MSNKFLINEELSVFISLALENTFNIEDETFDTILNQLVSICHATECIKLVDTSLYYAWLPNYDVALFTRINPPLTKKELEITESKAKLMDISFSICLLIEDLRLNKIDFNDIINGVVFIDDSNLYEIQRLTIKCFDYLYVLLPNEVNPDINYPSGLLVDYIALCNLYGSKINDNPKWKQYKPDRKTPKQRSVSEKFMLYAYRLYSLYHYITDLLKNNLLIEEIKPTNTYKKLAEIWWEAEYNLARHGNHDDEEINKIIKHKYRSAKIYSFIEYQNKILLSGKLSETEYPEIERIITNILQTHSKHNISTTDTNSFLYAIETGIATIPEPSVLCTLTKTNIRLKNETIAINLYQTMPELKGFFDCSLANYMNKKNLDR